MKLRTVLFEQLGSRLGEEQVDNRIFRQMLMICLIVFIISAKGYIQSQDTGYSIQTAQAIASHRQLNIQYSAGNTLIGRDGKSYSKWGTGLAFYYLPWVAAATGLSHITRLPDYEVIGLLISFANIPFAIFSKAFEVARRQADLFLASSTLVSTWYIGLAICRRRLKRGDADVPVNHHCILRGQEHCQIRDRRRDELCVANSCQTCLCRVHPPVLDLFAHAAREVAASYR